ncbi:MAG: hypothetical protein EHM33_31075 [Chloroflexi bacterium]|nr:MAG: hypothetical protein EHM33_31075 [Chloroflexota bacterium]
MSPSRNTLLPQRSLPGCDGDRLDIFEEASTGNFAAVQRVTTPIGSVNTLYLTIGEAVANVTIVTFSGLLLGLFLSLIPQYRTWLSSHCCRLFARIGACQ